MVKISSGSQKMRPALRSVVAQQLSGTWRQRQRSQGRATSVPVVNLVQKNLQYSEGGVVRNAHPELERWPAQHWWHGKGSEITLPAKLGPFWVAHSHSIKGNRCLSESGNQNAPGARGEEGKGAGSVGSEDNEVEIIQFWTHNAEKDLISANEACRKYLLEQADLDHITPFRRRNPSIQVTSVHQEAEEADVVFLVQDVQRACMMRYKSQREFRREQLKRDLKRRRLAHTLERRLLPLSHRGGPALLPHDVYIRTKNILAAMHVGGKDIELEEPAAEDVRASGTKAVYTAIATNALVLVTKIVALAYTGSASVMSEVVHSVADLGNQCLLAVGIMMSEKEPDQTHPYGYTTERYVFSLISGCGIFFLGCGVSVHHGISGLLVSHPIEHVTVGMGVLAFSFFIEGYSLRVAYVECREEAERLNMSTWEYIMSGVDPMNVAVLMEDSVAVLGVGVAGTGLMLSHITGLSAFDSAGSIVNGILMGAIAIFLIQKNRHMLVGSAVPRQRLRHVISVLESDPVVASVHDVKALVIGTSHGRFKAEINFNAEVLARRCMLKMKGHMSDMQKQMSEAEVERNVVIYSEELVATIGDEVDRLEAMILKELPEIRHVDLEIL